MAFPAMSAWSSKYSPYYSAIKSNLTIDITTYFNDGGLSDAAGPSFDAAPICVQPPRAIKGGIFIVNWCSLPVRALVVSEKVR
jgi:hypothetical protein